MAKSQATAERLADKRSTPTDRAVRAETEKGKPPVLEESLPLGSDGMMQKEKAYIKMKSILLKVPCLSYVIFDFLHRFYTNADSNLLSRS